MKKIFTLTAIMCSLAFIANLEAQGIYQFFGNTINGAMDDKGTIFSLKYDGTGHKMLKSFELKNPGLPGFFDKPVAVNGKLYTVFSGSSTGSGFITELDPATNIYVRKANLNNIGGSAARSAPVLYNGELYGVTLWGGANELGLLYRFNPVTGALTKVHDFEAPTGTQPQATLTLFNGKLYGTTIRGGANDDGVLFEFDPATNSYSVEMNFTAAIHGTYQQTSFVEYNGLLWGISGTGGFAGNGGALYSYNPVTNAFSFKKNMSSVGLNGITGTPVILNNKMYSTGSNSEYGGIFEYDFASNTLTNEFSFTAQTAYLECDLVVFDNKLYGSARGSAVGSDGLIFQYDPGTNMYNNRMIMSATSGYTPTCALTLYNNRMYAWTQAGGADDDGTLIEYNPVPNAYVKKVDLGNDGRLLNPVATPVYFNGKVYGVMFGGGNNKGGGIYEYDLATGSYTDKYLFPQSMRGNYEGCGLVLVNNKLYGTSWNGGDDDRGALFEYDPVNNNFEIKHHFVSSTGSYTFSKITVYNGKIYGATSSGGANGMGTVFEYDPATAVYTVKVNFGGAFGRYPVGGLTAYNNRLYGTTGYGGSQDGGLLYEFNPAINSFVVRANFTEAASGLYPSASMTVHNGKLYGVTEKPGPENIFEGTLFEFDPVNFTLTKKHSFFTTTEFGARSGMVPMYKKLYGLAGRGGDNGAGAVYQYDPATGNYSTAHNFNRQTGNYSGRGELAKVPAKTAPGNPGSCTDAGIIHINATNNNEWVPLANEAGEAILEIHAGGNNLGSVSVNYYVHNAAVRTDGSGRPYLDRNFTITAQNQPTSQVNVRFYIRKNELDALKNTAGSNVATIGDLGVFKNDNTCSNALTGSATPVMSFNSAWREDYVLNASLTSFSSFYFGYRNFTVLPVNLLSFTGAKDGAANQLTWKASCTNPADFTLERSTDGILFTPITTINASIQDCSHPFNYTDAGVGNAKYYYRLKIKELNGPVNYSGIVFLNRDAAQATGIKILTNPVTGNSAHLQVNTPEAGPYMLTITDAAGRTIAKKNITAAAGTTQHIIDVSRLATGIYYLSYLNEGKITTVKFIKQQ